MKQKNKKMRRKEWFPRLSNRVSLNIGARFTLFYLIVLAITMVVTSMLYQVVNVSILERKVGELSVQTLNTIKMNTDILLGSINNFSKLILSNDVIQRILTEPSSYSNPDAVRRIQTSLALYMEADPSISSIHVFDNHGNVYSAGKQPGSDLLIHDFTQAPWYEEVAALKGKYILRANGGGIFREPASGNFLSQIRIVNSTQTAKPIGLLIINIRMEALQTSYASRISNYADVAIIDDNDSLIEFQQLPLIRNAEQILQQKNGFLQIEGDRYLVSTVSDPERGWTYFGVIPFSDVAGEYTQFSIITIIVLIATGIILFGGAVLISRVVTKPISKLTDAMKMVESGDFRKVEIVHNRDEIGRLQSQYNLMVDEIQHLIARVMQEQKIKRKTELNMLQAQIKPHFLYNSLEAISAYAALPDQGDTVYNLTIALANYYRNSLSKGSEIVTLEQELDIVRDYLLIQSVRFQDMFTWKFEVEPGAEKVKMLKLILQPLIENALYHGIQPKGEPGEILVRASVMEKHIEVTVQDDGVGMNEAELESIVGGQLDINLASFGLRGTIQRLRIFYNVENPFRIESASGSGTTITLYLPME